MPVGLNLLYLRIDAAAILFCQQSLAFLAEIMRAGMLLRETMQSTETRLASAAVKVRQHELLLAAAAAILLDSRLNRRCQKSFIKT